MKSKNRTWILLAVLTVSLAGPSMAGNVWDDFESYNVGDSLSSLGSWGANAGVTVSNNAFGNTTKFAALPSSLSASNTVPAGATGKVWVESQMAETARIDPASLPLVNPSSVVMVGVTTDGFAVVYNTAAGWDICTNDARGAVLQAGEPAGTWARVTVCEDFSTHQAALFLDGRLLRQRLPFINTDANALTGLRFRSGLNRTGYIDNVYVSNSIPPSLTNQTLSSTNDINGDGTPDAREILLYGAIAKMVPLDYATITGALAVASAGDRIGVSNATYSGSLALSNGVSLFGLTMAANATNLTIEGDMTVGTGSVMNTSGHFTVAGQVTVAAGGVLTISNTVAGFDGLAIGGEGLLKMVNGTLIVGGYTNSGNFTLSLVTNMVSSAGNGTITPSGTNTMISGWQDVTYALTGAEAYAVAALTINGAATNLVAARTATYTDASAGITNNRVISASFVYDGIRYVPSDHTTISGALAAATAGDRIVVAGGTYAESLVVGSNVTLSGSTVSGLTGMTIRSNTTVVLSGFTTFDVAGLAIQSGGVLQASNATLAIAGTTYSGTFTLDSGWSGLITPSTVNFADGFESYPTNLPLSLCGGHGWGVSDAGSVVQVSVVTQGVMAARVVAASTLSNVVAGLVAQSNIWTDVYLQDTSVKYPDASYPTTNSGRAVMLFVNTNNHVVIWNSNAWDECTQDMFGDTVPAVLTGKWVRVSVYEDFTAQKVALFVNGQLVRQQVPFVSPVASYHGFRLNSGAGAAYLDDVKVWTNLPSSLTNAPMKDTNNNRIPDALEIALYGFASQPPTGAIYLIR